MVRDRDSYGSDQSLSTARNLPEGTDRGVVIGNPGSSRLLGFYSGGGEVRVAIVEPIMRRFVPLSRTGLESLQIGDFDKFASLIDMLKDPEVEATSGLRRVSDLPEGVTGVETDSESPNLRFLAKGGIVGGVVLGERTTENVYFMIGEMDVLKQVAGQLKQAEMAA